MPTTPTPTPGLNQQQEHALQEVVHVIDEAVAAGRISPVVRTVFNQLITQTRALAAGQPAPPAAGEGLSAHSVMAEIQARTTGN